MCVVAGEDDGIGNGEVNEVGISNQSLTCEIGVGHREHALSGCSLPCSTAGAHTAESRCQLFCKKVKSHIEY